MNEWQLQDKLTLRWIQNPLSIDDKPFHLVAWELMFPSWQINENKKKWNEPSIDFIAFDGNETFSCIELKNEIKGKRALLSAYCQVLHRAHLFKTQYAPSKMLAAQTQCFNPADSYRIQSVQFKQPAFPFPQSPIVKPILAARKFPEYSTRLIEEWTMLQDEEFKDAIPNYSQNEEFRRMLDSNCWRERVGLLMINFS
jgi:hypothetical protein